MSMRFSVIIQVIGYLEVSLKQLDYVVSKMFCDSCENTQVFFLFCICESLID